MGYNLTLNLGNAHYSSAVFSQFSLQYPRSIGSLGLLFSLEELLRLRIKMMITSGWWPAAAAAEQ